MGIRGGRSGHHQLPGRADPIDRPGRATFPAKEAGLILQEPGDNIRLQGLKFRWEAAARRCMQYGVDRHAAEILRRGEASGE